MKILATIWKTPGVFVCTLLFVTTNLFAQETRLLRQPSLSENHIAFCYGSDIWVADADGKNVKRLTSTQAVESDPYISPDGKTVAFTSNRNGYTAVFTVSIEGGDAHQITWHPSADFVRGWTPDGSKILFASSRGTAPSSFNRLWTISPKGGPASLLSEQRATDGSFHKNGVDIVIDPVRRWDIEWRAYRGGQNTPLVLLNTKNSKEELLPNEKTTDIKPVWHGDEIYFLSDRDFVANIWSFNTKSKALNQLTTFTGSDVKNFSIHGNTLVFERDGYFHKMNLTSKDIEKMSIQVIGDFPWAATDWKTVTNNARSVSLSPTGKRALMEARGEIFTVPLENGDARNLTQSSNAADRTPIWSPKGDKIAWFSDKSGNGYELMVASQDGMSAPRVYDIGESHLGWEPQWSPDGKHIAYTDDDVRVKILTLATGAIKTIAVGGTNLERGRMDLTWSPDSNWLAYSKSGANNFKQIFVWSLKDDKSTAITNAFANSFAPTWDLDQKHMYFLASTDVALGSGWANTSSMTSDPVYAAYVITLQAESNSPFKLKSDEEEVKKEEDKNGDKDKEKDKDKDKDKPKGIQIDFENISRRTLALPIPERQYGYMLAGPKGHVFIGEYVPNQRGATLQKFNLKEGEMKPFATGIRQVAISSDAKTMIANYGSSWKILKPSAGNDKGAKPLKVRLQMKLDLQAEWKQIFEEAWRYERDYFYDPNMHGRDWDLVYKRYAPLVPHVKHRADLNYILDQVNGELSVGHSFVGGGDYPSVKSSKMGLLGADLVASNGRWKLDKIFTTESWNPNLVSPLDQPGLNIKEGYYLVGINGKELKATDNPYQFLDGTVGMQTTLHLNDKPDFAGAWTEVVKPIRSENGLRQREWVESNRRMVDKLSNGKLGYIWVPNTGGPGFVSFNRYFFAQQDKLGAVIDERFNGGGLLDDYMVDLMTRSIRAGLTNEVPDGKPMRLPAGILGPKVLLINELAGSGGDFFPWVFRQQNAGKLIGTTTWGGLVKSSVHYGLVDGGYMTAPDNAVFDPINNVWVAENEGVAPDIEVRQDAAALSKGKDPQLEAAVKELMKQLGNTKAKEITPPAYSTPATKN